MRRTIGLRTFCISILKKAIKIKGCNNIKSVKKEVSLKRVKNK
jgi:hypothetical protein